MVRKPCRNNRKNKFKLILSNGQQLPERFKHIRSVMSVVAFCRSSNCQQIGLFLGHSRALEETPVKEFSLGALVGYAICTDLCLPFGTPVMEYLPWTVVLVGFKMDSGFLKYLEVLASRFSGSKNGWWKLPILTSCLVNIQKHLISNNKPIQKVVPSQTGTRNTRQSSWRLNAFDPKRIQKGLHNLSSSLFTGYPRPASTTKVSMMPLIGSSSITASASAAWVMVEWLVGWCHLVWASPIDLGKCPWFRDHTTKAPEAKRNQHLVAWDKSNLLVFQNPRCTNHTSLYPDIYPDSR